MSLFNKYLIIPFLLLFSYGISLSQSNEGFPARNSVIMDSLLNAAAVEIINTLQSYDIKNCSLNLSGSPAKILLKNLLVKHSEDKNLKLSEDVAEANNDNFCAVTIEDASVEYGPAEDDYLKRHISVRLISSIRLKGGELKSLPEINYYYYDKIHRNVVDHIEKAASDYEKGTVPEKDISLFEKIIEPAVIIVSAAATIVLLFTVRSE